LSAKAVSVTHVLKLVSTSRYSQRLLTQMTHGINAKFVPNCYVLDAKSAIYNTVATVLSNGC